MVANKSRISLQLLYLLGIMNVRGRKVLYQEIRNGITRRTSKLECTKNIFLYKMATHIAKYVFNDLKICLSRLSGIFQQFHQNWIWYSNSDATFITYDGEALSQKMTYNKFFIFQLVHVERMCILIKTGGSLSVPLMQIFLIVCLNSKMERVQSHNIFGPWINIEEEEQIITVLYQGL